MRILLKLGNQERRRIESSHPLCCLPACTCFRFRLAARIDDDHLYELELGHDWLGHDEWVEVRLPHAVREFVQDHDHFDRTVDQFQEA
jgi:hypothetical protein